MCSILDLLLGVLFFTWWWHVFYFSVDVNEAWKTHGREEKLSRQRILFPHIETVDFQRIENKQILVLLQVFLHPHGSMCVNTYTRLRLLYVALRRTRHVSLIGSIGSIWTLTKKYCWVKWWYSLVKFAYNRPHGRPRREVHWRCIILCVVILILWSVFRGSFMFYCFAGEFICILKGVLFLFYIVRKDHD